MAAGFGSFSCLLSSLPAVESSRSVAFATSLSSLIVPWTGSLFDAKRWTAEGNSYEPLFARVASSPSCFLSSLLICDQLAQASQPVVMHA